MWDDNKNNKELNGKKNWNFGFQKEKKNINFDIKRKKNWNFDA